MALMTACDPNASDFDSLKAGITKAATGLEAALSSGERAEAPAGTTEKGGAAAASPFGAIPPAGPPATKLK